MNQKKIRYSMMVVLAVLMGFFLSASVASANDNDFELSRICGSGNCAAGKTAFKDLSRNLAAVMSPGHFSGANTIGVAGFEASAQTRISFAKKSQGWQALNKNRGAVADSDGKYKAPDIFGTAQVHGRKGLPFGFEVFGFANWLGDSKMFMLGAGLAMSIVEGFYFLPDLTVRGSAGALVGSPDLNLIAVNADATLSYPIGIAGNIRLVPYGGYNLGVSIASSRPLNVPGGDSGSGSSGRVTEGVFGRVVQLDHSGFAGLELKARYFVTSVEGQFGKEVMSVGAKIGMVF